MKRQEEYALQRAVCRYLSLQYPDVLFLSDTVASVKMTVQQAVRNKAIQKHGFKCPDLIILEPRGDHAGLLIELKKESPYKKSGELRKDAHLIGQQESISKLNGKGYKACFGWGFEQVKTIIDEYLNQ